MSLREWMQSTIRGIARRLRDNSGGSDTNARGSGQRMTNETRSADIAEAIEALGPRLGKKYPTTFDARLKSGFDKHRDYDGERSQASERLSDDLSSSWKAGDVPSKWRERVAKRFDI